MNYSFLNDYSEGAHPRISKLLGTAFSQQEAGYGEDSTSLAAKFLIQKQLGDASGSFTKIYFVSGGTQANICAISHMLRPYEAIISAETAHINVHEAGAIEMTGHKILAARTADGKLSVQAIDEILQAHASEHMVKPKAVFLSQATELGTIYALEELKTISTFCKKYNLYLYLDGARLGHALTAEKSDMALADVARLVDMFYIGGTKNGAWCGEAMVITNPKLEADFKYTLKQRGALLAKGRMLGLQFFELFKDNLYFELAHHANTMAQKLASGIRECGYGFFVDSPTNQIFPIFPHEVIEELQKKYTFYSEWVKIDTDSSCVRLVTSWATREEKVDEFISDLRQFI